MVSEKEEQKKRRHRIEEYWKVDENGKNMSRRERQRIGTKAEAFAARVALGELGFDYILGLNNTMRVFRSGLGTFRKTFPFDFYCEKGDERWFIDVTTYVKKDIPMSPLWSRLGVKLGVLFIRRDLKEYHLKEASERSQVYLSLKDVGLSRLSATDAAYKAWETRRKRRKTAMESQTPRRVLSRDEGIKQERGIDDKKNRNGQKNKRFLMK